MKKKYHVAVKLKGHKARSTITYVVEATSSNSALLKASENEEGFVQQAMRRSADAQPGVFFQGIREISTGGTTVIMQASVA